MSLAPEYKSKVEDLFRCGEGFQVSWKHYQMNIVTNPKCFFNLVESNFLSQYKEKELLTFYRVLR